MHFNDKLSDKLDSMTHSVSYIRQCYAAILTH